MYKINKLQHGKRFVRDFHTRWFCQSEISLVRCAHSFDFRYFTTRVKIPYTRAFHEVISISFGIGDLSQIISFLHDSFLFRSSFFIRF